MNAQTHHWTLSFPPPFRSYNLTQRRPHSPFLGGIVVVLQCDRTEGERILSDSRRLICMHSASNDWGGQRGGHSVNVRVLFGSSRNSEKHAIRMIHANFHAPLIHLIQTIQSDIIRPDGMALLLFLEWTQEIAPRACSLFSLYFGMLPAWHESIPCGISERSFVNNMKKPKKKNSACLLYFHLSQNAIYQSLNLSREISLDCIAFFREHARISESQRWLGAFVVPDKQQPQEEKRRRRRGMESPFSVTISSPFLLVSHIFVLLSSLFSRLEREWARSVTSFSSHSIHSRKKE